MQMLYIGSDHAVSSDLLSKLLHNQANSKFKVRLVLEPELPGSSHDGFDTEYEEWFIHALKESDTSAVLDATYLFSNGGNDVQELTKMAQRVEQSLASGVEYVILCPEKYVESWVMSRKSNSGEGDQEWARSLSYLMSIAGKYDTALTLAAVPELVSRYYPEEQPLNAWIRDICNRRTVTLQSLGNESSRRVCLDDVTSAIDFYLSQPRRLGVLMIPGSPELSTRNISTVVADTLDSLVDSDGNMSFRELIHNTNVDVLKSKDSKWWLEANGWKPTGMALVELKSIVAQTLVWEQAQQRLAA